MEHNEFRQELIEMIKNLNLKPGDFITRSQMYFWFSKKKNDGKIPEKEFTFGPGIEFYTTNSKWRNWEKVSPEDDLFFMDYEMPYYFHIYDKEKDPPPVYSLKDYYLRYGNPSFSYEKDLQNYLKKNLHVLEPGLKLFEEEGVLGFEFFIEGKRIDILAVDRNNNLVVIETKVSQPHEKVIGQITTYMGYIKNKIAKNNQKVRGIIVANKISSEIKAAASVVPEVDVYEYSLTIEIKKVKT